MIYVIDTVAKDPVLAPPNNSLPRRDPVGRADRASNHKITPSVNQTHDIAFSVLINLSYGFRS